MSCNTHISVVYTSILYRVTLTYCIPLELYNVHTSTSVRRRLHVCVCIYIYIYGFISSSAWSCRIMGLTQKPTV